MAFLFQRAGCTFETLIEKQFEMHVEKRHKDLEENNTLCVLCGKRYKTKASLYSHTKMMHSGVEEKPKLECTQCKQLFKNAQTLEVSAFMLYCSF